MRKILREIAEALAFEKILIILLILQLLTLVKTGLDVHFRYDTPKVAVAKTILDLFKVLYYFFVVIFLIIRYCLLYTSPSPRD